MRIEILPDKDAENPRDQWDPAGTMGSRNKVFLRRFSVGGEKEGKVIEGIEAMARIGLGGVALAMFQNEWAEEWSCGKWDGNDEPEAWIWMTDAKARKAGFVRKDGKIDRKAVIRHLKAEVAEYSAWCSGDVWGYRILLEDGEEFDSCWGFYGRRFAEEAAKEAAERIQKRDEQYHFDMAEAQ